MSALQVACNMNSSLVLIVCVLNSLFRLNATAFASLPRHHVAKPTGFLDTSTGRGVEPSTEPIVNQLCYKSPSFNSARSSWHLSPIGIWSHSIEYHKCDRFVAHNKSIGNAIAIDCCKYNGLTIAVGTKIQNKFGRAHPRPSQLAETSQNWAWTFNWLQTNGSLNLRILDTQTLANK